MSEALPLMLKELKLPTFGQYYQDYQDRTSNRPRVTASISLHFVSRRWLSISKVESAIGHAKPSCHVAKALPHRHSITCHRQFRKKLLRFVTIPSGAHQADNILLISTSGVGKSHIAAALGLHLIEQGIKVKWIPATALVQHLQQVKKDLDLMTAMTRLDKYRVLIIDNIGYVKKTDSETQALFEFVAHRYESGSLIITSNQPFSQWDQIFPDTMMTVAAIDRIIHHATIIEIDSESYRGEKPEKIMT